MTDSDADLEGFVPLDARTARALDDAAAALAIAKRELDRAAEELFELTEDMKIDAVRRLGERGASSAQIERYESAYRASVEAVRERSAALEAACARMREAVRAVRT